MALELKKETRAAAVASIQRFFAECRDEEMGNFQAAELLEFFLQEIAPVVYNQAVLDAQAELRQRIADLDVACFEEEFSYWPRRRRR